MRLKDFWRSQPYGCAIGFSGGVDSAFLIASGLKWAKIKILPIFLDSIFVSQTMRDQAKHVADSIGIKPVVFKWDPLAINEICRNDRLRCYYCKKNLYLTINKNILYTGNCSCSTIIDGTQADDLLKQRPGLFALQELEIQIPLAEIGFTKADIRRCLRMWGYDFWNLPAESCLTTRIGYGKRLTKEVLMRNFDPRYKKNQFNVF